MNKIPLIVRKIKEQYLPKKASITEVRLAALTACCQTYIKEHRITPKLKILWPTIFNQDKTWWAHDGVLISALKLRGVDVIPTMCDQLQSEQCLIHGGLWQESYKKNYASDRNYLCNQCVQNDLRLWDILNIKPIRLTSYISTGERTRLWHHANTVTEGDWEQFVYQGYPVGKEAWKAVVNNNLQGDIKPSWKQQAKHIAKYHIFNIIAIFHVYERILTVMKPDRVVGNGGFYYQWGVLNHLCQQQDLSYFRYYQIGLQPLAWNYTLNSTELFDITPAWSSWIKQPWGEKETNQVIEDFSHRGLCINLADSPIHKERVQQIAQNLSIDPSKPTAIALLGIIWDAATNVESASFVNMYQWLWETIRWFGNNQEFQLIIRVHPAEDVGPTVAPNERTRFEKELAEQGISLPQNVFIIRADQPIETYDLMHIADIGITYTSTSGLEFACLAKPLIVVGPAHYAQKGFTFDPNTKTEYYSILRELLTTSDWKSQSHQARFYQEKAMKYWYLAAFHVSSITGLFETPENVGIFNRRVMKELSAHPKQLTAESLLPGANEHLDYFCEAVINNMPIIGENRWPPSNQNFSKMSD